MAASGRSTRRGLRAPPAGALAAVLALLLVEATAGAAAPATGWRLGREVPLPGDEGWDYLTFEEAGHRLFIAHGDRVLVVDTDTYTVAGEVRDTPRAHGIALVPDAGRGYVTAGRANTIVAFDLGTLAHVAEIRSTGEEPDGIVYEPATRRVLAFNGRGRNATVIEAASGALAGTIALEGKPESAVADGHGRVYVDLEDRDSIAVLDARTLRVLDVWPVAGCKDAIALALDAAGQRLYAACGNRRMAMVDAATGRVVGTVPIAGGVDFAAYDATADRAYASCGEGALVSVARDAAGAPTVAQTVATRIGARTMALDERGRRIFLVTADLGPPPPATPEHPHPRPAIVPGTFRLLVLTPVAHGG